MRDTVEMFVNGRRRTVVGAAVFQPLTEFLRSDLQLTGTKVVCAEGDCGSCTVFLGKPAGDRIDYRTVTSCIQYIYQLDGVHVVTVEGLKYGNDLNPVQQAMVKNGGAQCGFCTPGFVVSMYAMFEGNGHHEKPIDDHQLRRGLTGNLCRCTGYEPILRAGLAVDAAAVKKLDELYPPDAMLPAMRDAHGLAVKVTNAGRTFYKPTSVADAVAFKRDTPNCTIISGGTDLGVQMNKGLRQLTTVMSTAALGELEGVRVENGNMIVGARATITDLEFLAAEHVPEYSKVLAYFGSPPIKNAGTVGGNLANGSPIADSPPALFALDAEIELVGVTGRRRVSIASFYTGYKQTCAKLDELIAAVVIPLPRRGEVLKLYKVSKRKDLDISAFTAAVWMRLDGMHIESARVAYGGVGPTVMRMSGVEELLADAEATEDLFDEAADVAAAAVKPISDVRGSADYRSRLAANVMRKLWLDVFVTDEVNDGRGFINADASATDGQYNGNGHA